MATDTAAPPTPNTPPAPPVDQLGAGGTPSIQPTTPAAVPATDDHSIWQRIKDFHSLPGDQYDKKYAADDQATQDKVTRIAEHIIPGLSEADRAQAVLDKTKAGQKVSQFVADQVAHPEQFAMGGEFGGEAVPEAAIEGAGKAAARVAEAGKSALAAGEEDIAAAVAAKAPEGSTEAGKVSRKAKSAPIKQNAAVGFIDPQGKFEEFNSKKGKDFGDEATHDDFAANRDTNVNSMTKAGWVRKAGQGSYQTGKLNPATTRAIENDVIMDYSDLKHGNEYGQPVSSIFIDTDKDTHEIPVSDFIEKYNGDLNKAIQQTSAAKANKIDFSSVGGKSLMAGASDAFERGTAKDFGATTGPTGPQTRPGAEENTLTYRTDSNGTMWAKSPDSPAEVSIPKGLSGADADTYAQNKLDLQRNFAANRVNGGKTAQPPPPDAIGVHKDDVPWRAKYQDVDFSAQDLQDSDKTVTADTIRRDYANNRKDVSIYTAYVPMEDVPSAQFPVDAADESEASDFDREDYSRVKTGVPIKLSVTPKGDIEILDGNHRVQVWGEQKQAYAPAWVVDYRHPAIENLSEDEKAERDEESGNEIPGHMDFSTVGGTEVQAPQGGHAGGGVASVEELNRPGRFVKVSRSGALTDQGKTPDFNLRPGEVGYQVKPDGTFEVKDGMETPAHKAAIQRYANDVFPKPKPEYVQTLARRGELPDQTVNLGELYGDEGGYVGGHYELSGDKTNATEQPNDQAISGRGDTDRGKDVARGKDEAATTNQGLPPEKVVVAGDIPDWRDEEYGFRNAEQKERTERNFPHLGGAIPPMKPLPDTGQYAAVRTTDGSIFYDPDWQGNTHILFIRGTGIPPDKVQDGGWLQDGVYEPTLRSEASQYGDRARAALRTLSPKTKIVPVRGHVRTVKAS